jgi:hypothetical protein
LFVGSSPSSHGDFPGSRRLAPNWRSCLARFCLCTGVLESPRPFRPLCLCPENSVSPQRRLRCCETAKRLESGTGSSARTAAGFGAGGAGAGGAAIGPLSAAMAQNGMYLILDPGPMPNDLITASYQSAPALGVRIGHCRSVFSDSLRLCCSTNS